MNSIIIENEKIKVSVIPQGATLVSFIYKGNNTELVLGLNTENAYLEKNSGGMGKTIGRCANRIGNAKFTLNGITYNLLANNGINTLHGGAVNFGNVIWNVDSYTNNKVVFSYLSKDMEAGFPGDLLVHAIYEINDSELSIHYDGKSNKDTIMNLTNHTYFNLNRKKVDILSHNLQIFADSLCENDENGMSTENIIKMGSSKYDFSIRKKIGNVISKEDTNLLPGIDHAYLYNSFNEKKLCRLDNDILYVDIYSTLPAAHFYTGTGLNVDGRDGHYGKFAGIAIEPEFVPNAINYNKFDKPILKANEYKEFLIRYKVGECGF